MLKKLPALLTLLLLASATLAQSLPPEDQTFFNNHTSDFLTLTPKKITDPDITKTFSAPIFDITIAINTGDGDQTQKQIVARLADKLVPLSRPSTDSPCPILLKMLNPAFTLATDADAKSLQSALNTLYPPVTDDDKKAVSFQHANHTWAFIRGTFFDKKMGFVFTTDNAGKITHAKYVLELP